MKSETLAIPGLVRFTPDIHGDDRGFLFESFNERDFQTATGTEARFVQENHSRSARGVLRGIHLQAYPGAQGKLVRVVRGAIFDVAVDARRHSPTFGQWCGVELSESNRHALWVPAGFGHGFLSLSDDTEVIYRLTDYWQPELQRFVRWNDPAIGIEWPIDPVPVLAPRDANADTLAHIPEHELVPV
jgi:dTDP-4-dehydrorhamnose 3,5-epimerase